MSLGRSILAAGDKPTGSSEADVRTPLAIPKPELPTTERTNLRLGRGGAVVAPPMVAMPPIIMRPFLSCGRNPTMPTRRARSGEAWRAPKGDGHGQQQRCDGCDAHFHGPHCSRSPTVQTASDGKRWRTPRMRCGYSGYEWGRPTCPQGFSVHPRCGDAGGFQRARLRSPDCGRRRSL